MAAFAQATPTPAAVSTRTRAPSHSKLLHDGPCNYVNADLGLNAPVCGCQRFWCSDNSSIENPYCVCGHHTVFHTLGSDLPLATSTSFHLENPAPAQTTIGTSLSGRQSKADPGAHERHSGPADGSQPDSLWNVSKAGWQSAATATRRTPASDPVKSAPQPPVFATGRQLGPRGGKPSPLPSVPSMCRLNSSDLRPQNNQTDSMATEIVPSPIYRSLGMSLHSTTEELNQVLTTPTHAGISFHRTLDPHRWREVSMDPTVQDSTDGESTRPRNSPSRTFMTQILARRTAQNNEAPRPISQVVDRVAQTAAAITTSPENTPDFSAFDQSIQETRGLIDNLCENLADIEKPTHIADVKDEHRPSPPDQEGAHASQDSLGSRTISLLRRLAPNLNVLHKHLTTYPNVSTEISDFKNRLVALENASFQHIPPEEILDKFENFDGRLLELEQRVKDYMADYYETDSSDQDAPVASDASGNDHGEAIRRLEALEYRLENLEATLPSPSNPWEIEVVLLPWGRDLRGIWFPAPECEGGFAGSQSSEDRTQSASSLSSVKAQPLLMSAEQTAWSKEAINHWANASLEQHDTQGFLAPRACGRNGIPYKRLQSRGFVRRVCIKEPGAEHIHTSICAEFDELIELINSSCRPLEDEEDSQMSYDEQIGTTLLHGMRASILPLKKKRKDAQLMFLGPSELVTPTLWNAHFLASGVMMRARGGVKRLYMTHGAAYQQSQVDDADGWTWESIRRLPRFNPSSNGHEVRMGDADTREACWEFHPNFDQPSFNTKKSFTSNLSLRPGGNPSQESSSLGYDSQGNESSGSQETTAAYKAPITPQSELLTYGHPLPPARRPLERTASAPMPYLERQHSNSSSKRRNLSFEGDDGYDENNFTRRAFADVLTSRKKRRRIRQSRSPTTDAPLSSRANAVGVHNASTVTVGFGAGTATRDAFGFTPRRSREPSSPARSQVYRGNSVASGGGYVQAGSVVASAGACKGSASTPVANNAYMTPHSGVAEGGTYVDGLFEGGDTEADSSGDDAEDDEMVDVETEDEAKAAAAAAAATAGSPDGGDFGGWSGLENDDDDDDDPSDEDGDVDIFDHYRTGQGDLDMELEGDNDDRREMRERGRQGRDGQRQSQRLSPNSTTAMVHAVDDTDVSVEIHDPSDVEHTTSDHDEDDFSSPEDDEDVDIVGNMCGATNEDANGDDDGEDDGLWINLH